MGFPDPSGPRYPFWTDIVGILSVPWDHSLVADNFVDIFEERGWILKLREHKGSYFTWENAKGPFPKLLKLMKRGGTSFSGT